MRLCVCLFRRSTTANGQMIFFIFHLRKKEMTSSTSTYSFWLVPAVGTPARNRAQRLIDTLALKHGAPKFVPHVTLAGGFRSAHPNSSTSSSTSTPSSSSSSFSDATLAARALAESHPAFSRPLKVTLQSVSCGSTYHRCVYALAEVSEELRAAAAAAGEAALGVEAAAVKPAPPSAASASSFKPDETCMPHLSLLYSSDEKAKEEGLAEAGAAFAEAFREEEGVGKEKEKVKDETETETETCWLSSEIEVWMTEGDVGDWRCEARVPFGGKK